MANSVKIKRGSGVPSSSDLAVYELGYRTGTSELYINDNGIYRQVGGTSGGGAVDSISNFADNRVLTASDADSIRGEGNLTFDGSTLAVTGAISTTSTITAGGVLTSNNRITSTGNGGWTIGNYAGYDRIQNSSNIFSFLTDGNAYANMAFGTVTAGTWQGTAIASAYLDADTAHLSTNQTFSGAKTFTGRVTISDAGADGLHLNQDTGATTNSNRLFFTGSATSAIFQEGSDLSFRTGATAGSSSGTERFHLNSSGLQINTGSQLYVDDIYGQSNGTNRLVLDDDTQSGIANGVSLTGVNHIYICADETNNGTGAIKFRKGTDNDLDSGTSVQLAEISNAGVLTVNGGTIDIPNAGDWSFIKNNTNSGGLRFGTKDGSGNYANQIEISNAGNYVKLNENTTVTGQLTATTIIHSNQGFTTDYGIRFNNGATDFMFYNNTNDNLFYLRDLTNSQMLQTWTTSSTTIHKPLYVSGATQVTGYSGSTSHFQLNFSGSSNSLLKIVNSGWSNETTHDILFNYWSSNIGDYTYLKSAGNSTSGHGIALVGDSLFAVGDTTVATGAVTNSATAPFTDTWFYVNGSGNGWLKNDLTVGGTNYIDGSGDQMIRFQRSGADVVSIEQDSSQLYFYNRTTSKVMFLMSETGSAKLGYNSNPTLELRNTATSAGSGPSLVFGHSQGGNTSVGRISTYLTDGSESNRSGLMRLWHTQAGTEYLKLQLGDNYVRQYQKGDTSDYLETIVNDDHVNFHVASGNYIQVSTDHGTLAIGPQNTSHCHYSTDRSNHWFNTRVVIEGGVLDSYNEDLNLRRASSDADKIEIAADYSRILVNSTERFRATTSGATITGHAYATSSYLAPDGSATTPAYRFNNDGNTGMYLAGTDALGFSVGGNIGMQLTSAHALRIYQSDDTTDYMEFYANDTHAYYHHSHGTMHRFITDSGYIELGPANTGWGHIQTDRAKFYFNKQITVDSGVITAYDEDLSLQRNHDSANDSILIASSSIQHKLDGNTKLQINSDGRINYNGWTGVDHITVRSNGHTNSASSSTFYIKFCTVVVDNSPSNYNGLNLSGTLYNGDNNHGNTIDWSVWFNAALDNAQISHGGYMMSKGAHWISNIFVQRTAGDGEIDNGSCTYELYYDINNNWANNFYNVATEVHYPNEGKFNVTWNHDQSEVTSLPGTEVVNMQTNYYDDGNQTLVQNGAVGSPSYSFLGSRNTGIYRNAADQIGFATAGERQMYLFDGGLQIEQPVRINFANDQRIFDNGSGGLSVGAESHELRLYSGGTDPIEFRTGGRNGTTRMNMYSTNLDLGSGDFSIKKTGGNNTNNYPAVEVYSAGTAENQAAIAIQQQTSEGDTIIFADFEPHVEWGISADNSADEIHFTGGSSTGSLGTKTFKNNAGSNRTAYKKMSVGLSNGNVNIGGNLTVANGSAYAGDSTSGVLSTGTWIGDLGSNGWERVCGVQHDGGVFSIVEKNAQISTIVDGSYFAYEAGTNQGGGFYSSSNSTYGAATGIVASGGTLYVKQADGTNASLHVTGDFSLSSGFISGVGSADLQIRRTTNNDDRIVIEASETKIYGDAVERVRFGSYGIRNGYSGSEGGPVYSFKDDTDTGLWRAASDTLAVTTGGTNRMKFQSDGKIGVNGDTSDAFFRINSTSSQNGFKLIGTAARAASRYAVHIDDNDTNGRGSVVIDSASGTGMKITTQNNNWNMELVSADGGGSPAMSMGVRMQSFEGRANGHYHFDEDYSGQWFSGLRYAGATTNWQVGYRDGSSGNSPDYLSRARIMVDNNGNLHADADVIAYSSTIGSDIKLKKNVKDINYGLKDVLDIRAVEFDWKEKRDGKHDIGFIAQEIEKIIPEVVNEVTTIGEGAEDGDTHKVVDYAKLTSVLIKAVQEQQQQINELKEKLNG